MVRSICAAILVYFVASFPLLAQPRPTWKVLGDTTGAPHGCSAALGIAAISAWFDAFSNADSVGLARATPPRGARFGVFTSGRFVPTEGFVQIESLPALVHYARTRSLQHERLTIEAVRFYRWHRRSLGFMPYFSRSADDLGSKALSGIGKGAYLCNEGILILNLGPRPADVPAP
jgi:hypothetical protein